MPFYRYRCSEGHVSEIYRKVMRAVRSVRCKTCRRRAGFDYGQSLPSTQGDLRPFYSEAMGIGHPGDAMPGRVYDRLGRMRIESRADLKAMQKAHGLKSRRSYTE